MNALLRANLKSERAKNVDIEQFLANHIVKQEGMFKKMLSGLRAGVAGSVKAAVYKLKVKKGIVKQAGTQSRPIKGLNKLTKLPATTPPIAAPPPPPNVDPTSNPPQRDASNGSMIDVLRGRSSSSS